MPRQLILKHCAESCNPVPRQGAPRVKPVPNSASIDDVGLSRIRPKARHRISVLSCRPMSAVTPPPSPPTAHNSPAHPAASLRVAVQEHLHRPAPLLQQPRHHEPVAAVVPRPAQHHRAARRALALHLGPNTPGGPGAAPRPASPPAPAIPRRSPRPRPARRAPSAPAPSPRRCAIAAASIARIWAAVRSSVIASVLRLHSHRAFCTKIRQRAGFGPAAGPAASLVNCGRR